jgi:hypothetical protein
MQQDVDHAFKLSAKWGLHAAILSRCDSGNDPHRVEALLTTLLYCSQKQAPSAELLLSAISIILDPVSRNGVLLQTQLARELLQVDATFAEQAMPVLEHLLRTQPDEEVAFHVLDAIVGTSCTAAPTTLSLCEPYARNDPDVAELLVQCAG